MVMNAPCSALGLRVNCTAEASARCSRRRDTAACNSRPASMPTLPAMKTPSAMILMRPAPLPRLRPRMMRMARSVITNRPKIHAVSRMLMLHVAVEDVTELVADDGLQLLAVELVERALRDRDRGFVRRMARGERVDALLFGQHEDLRFADARRDGHLLDDVEQALALEVALLRGDRHAAQRTRDDAAAGAQLRALVPARRPAWCPAR